MLPYWILFAATSAFALSDLGRPVDQRRFGPAIILIAFLVLAMIGLRYDVGADWTAYHSYLDLARYSSLVETLARKDPGYQFLNWFVARIGWGIWAVNTLAAAIFVYGLFRFIKTLPSPGLATAIAVPYLITVVAMGYTRQGAAIGMVMAALASVRSKSWTRAIVELVTAVTLHKSAIIVLPIAALSRTQAKVPVAAGLVILVALLYYLLIDRDIDSLMYTYLDRGAESSGALIRVIMNAIPATLFLMLGRRIPLADKEEYRLWRNFSYAAIICIPAIFLLSSSTVVDRLALCIIPIQLFMFSWLPIIMGNNWKDDKLTFIAIITYSALIQFVWLNYASHSDEWYPYLLYPLAASSS